nr:MAG TPA: leucine rich repeat protein [Caudoviricetes sp.]
MSVNIKYKNNSIAELTDTGTKTLKTAGKYCEADIIVENTKDGGGAKEPYIEETYNSDGQLTSAVMHGHLAIRNQAFFECRSLTSVVMPSNITRIGYDAFKGCLSLTSITIPDSVTDIGNSAFMGCDSLTSITIPSGVTSIEDHTFSCCGLMSVVIPDSVIGIGVDAFGMNEFTSITIPSSVKFINFTAFNNCRSLTSVTFNGTPISVQDNIFNDCQDLTTINVPWAEGVVSGAPWGATNATINYNYTGA